MAVGVIFATICRQDFMPKFVCGRLLKGIVLIGKILMPPATVIDIVLKHYRKDYRIF